MRAAAFIIWFLMGAIFSCDAGDILTGAGATFPYPLYNNWIRVYQKSTDVRITYSAVGSGKGISQLIEKYIDFGATDLPLSEEEIRKLPSEIVLIPTCVGAVVVPYNLPNNPRLNLTPSTLADIFLGRIRTWNDKQLVEINPGINLPALEIAVVHRSDPSGTTGQFTRYLNQVSQEWSETCGEGKEILWPLGMGVEGNSRIVEMIQRIPGSIGYTELTYAYEKNLVMANLRNESRHFIQPTLESITDGIAQSEELKSPTNDAQSVSKGYPIVGFSYMAVYKEQAYDGRSRDRATNLAKLLWWMIHEGQKFNNGLLYGRLPARDVVQAENLIRSMTYEGKPLVDW